jgi:hypothetical protein
MNPSEQSLDDRAEMPNSSLFIPALSVRAIAEDLAVDMVFDTGLAGQRRKTLALHLFPLDARLSRVLHAEDTPGAAQRTAQRRLLIEIALDDFDALACQRRRPLAVRLSRQAAQTEPGALQRLRYGAALIACRSGDENRSIVCHSWSPVIDRNLLFGAVRSSGFYGL